MIAARSLSTLFADEAISVFGYTFEEFLRALGLGVVAVGVGVCIIGCTKQILPLAVWLIIGIEAIWTMGSILLLVWAGNALSWSGIAFVILSAMAVLGFMIFELIGLLSLLHDSVENAT
ncbi:hypothetical protein [Leptolyngbya sp. FACHB-261]|uniref:hypothetical protein n=1 Tax=Leptolyngbya sp. FACHB-261 TaxID=2692806 RepID=UPI00168505FA|nr:hypothetical protein [Leptolyngbya sp. FACHB-261]